MKFLVKTALISFLSFHYLAGISQVSSLRIDPPFWWTGMEDPSLQLMVHGDGIAESNVIADYPGISLKRVIRLENPNYLILDLEISDDAVPGKIPIIFEHQREILFRVEYQLRKRDTGSGDRNGFGKDDVIYLVMPDRFSNGKPGNDSVPGMLEAAHRSDPNGRHGGDLEGIRDMIDYIADLGVTAVWFNPVLENNLPAYSYHGYAITDFYNVDPRFGDNEEYRKLVEAFHRKGLKVIMDMVFNHCGGNHFWMHDMPMESWVHQFPEYTRSNFRAETAMDPYASDFDRERMLTGWFDRPMPDLNQHNEILANYLVQNSIWWIEYAGLDGIRMDTYPYSYKDFMSKWLQRVMQEYPNFNVVGETWLQKETHTAFWQQGSPVSDKNSCNLTSVTDFPMQYALKDAFNENEGWTTGLARLYYVLTQDLAYSDPFSNVIFADNHDLTRLYSSLGENFNKFKMAMTVLTTTRGIPMIYYGTELLMTGEENKGHGFIRQDFPLGEWGTAVGGQRSAVGGQQPVLRAEPEGSAVSSQQEEGLEFVKTLLNWRKGAEVIHHGRLKQFVPQDGIYVYFRYDEKDAVMVVINKNKEDRQLELSRFMEVLKDYHSGKDIMTGQTLMLKETLHLTPETALILELD
jgi:neopullulanase